MQKYSGFTLVEIMVTLLVAGILAALAIPNFRAMLVRRQVESAVSALMSDFSFARSEALKRGHSVTICRWGAGQGQAATCAPRQGSWHDGWLVFDDRNGDGTRDTTTEPVLRQQGRADGISAIAAQTVSATERFVQFRPSGMAIGTANHFIVTPASSGVAAAPAGGPVSAPPSAPPGSRLLCLSNQGRLVLRPAPDVPPC